MPLQIDGRTPGELRVARDDGSLATVGEARVWDDGVWHTVYTSIKSVTMYNPGGPGALWEYISGDLDLLVIVDTGSSGSTLRRGPGEERIEFNVPVTATHQVGLATSSQFRPGEIIPAGQALRGSHSVAGDITFTEAT